MSKGFEILESLLRATGRRHRVLASNIANSDTPGYKARDLDFRGIVKEEMLKLKTTDAGHIKASGTGPAEGTLETVQRPSWNDENNVELDAEIAKMTENSLLFEASVQLLSQRIRQFKDAVRGGR